MALIKCSECGRDVSDMAAACPSCGAPTPRTLTIRQARTQSSTGKTLAWVFGLLIGIPVVLFFGSAIIAGIWEAESGKPIGYTGVLRVNPGIEYVLADVESPIGGQCNGWKAVLVRKPGDDLGGMRNLMCWRRVGNKIEVNTQNGVGRRTDPMEYFKD